VSSEHFISGYKSEYALIAQKMYTIVYLHRFGIITCTHRLQIVYCTRGEEYLVGIENTSSNVGLCSNL
jgi:hypothetical protein